MMREQEAEKYVHLFDGRWIVAEKSEDGFCRGRVKPAARARMETTHAAGTLGLIAPLVYSYARRTDALKKACELYNC